MRKISIAVVLFFAFGAACVVPPADHDMNAHQVKVHGPTAYGNGVYYFDAVGEEFGVALAQFVGEPPNRKTVLAITGDGTGSYGSDTGYWVVIDERPEKQ